MPKKKQTNFIGSWAFLIGVILAVIFGIAGNIGNTVMWLLVVIGVVVGLLNVAEEEVQPFLFSGIVLIIASAFGQSVVSVSPVFNRVFDALLLIFVPSTIIVAIRNVFSIARR
ncbi:MAG: hypothetical protein ACP5D2_04960 [Candidatus Nanoarchaeia archaeon]